MQAPSGVLCISSRPEVSAQQQVWGGSGAGGRPSQGWVTHTGPEAGRRGEAGDRVCELTWSSFCSGVHSPTLSGTSQLDAFRPLLPATILVASAELGGISTTVSAYESLHLRGYHLDAVLTFREEYYRNFDYFQKFFAERGIQVGVVDSPPPKLPAVSDAVQMAEYYAKIGGDLRGVVEGLQGLHEKRILELETAPRRTLDSVWWPFVQHGMVTKEEDVMVIDSAHADFFSTFRKPSEDESALAIPTISASAAVPAIPPSATVPLLAQTFDGSASWWTQCLGHGHPELTLAAAHAAGRYGHVLFPTATNAPALQLTERLLATVGQGWASRVFFSDDGSTGMEVALKMALKASAERLDLPLGRARQELGVLGLKGAYHGDTIGAMDAADPNVYNEQVDWYKGRGFWLEPPAVGIEDGRAVVRTEQSGQADARETVYNSLSEVYDVDGRLCRGDALAEVYRTQIRDAVRKQLDATPGLQFGALVLEPVVMGAAGMVFVDPLFQRVLVDLVRTDRDLFPAGVPDGAPAHSSRDGTPTWAGLPVVFDEVFVGLHRLGRTSARTFLGKDVRPDLACYAKILTGGLVPMSVTVASDAVFQAFWGDRKVDALLHGHSYTAHPIGCSVANRTLDILDGMHAKGAFDAAKADWAGAERGAASKAEVVATSSSPAEPVWSVWSAGFVDRVSRHAQVQRVHALGTVLAVHLAPEAGAGDGYQSPAAQAFLDRLAAGERLAAAGWEFAVHARPLGSVVYLMASLNSRVEVLRAVEEGVVRTLG